MVGELLYASVISGVQPLQFIIDTPIVVQQWQSLVGSEINYPILRY